MEKTELRKHIKKLAEENQDSIKKDSEKICKKILDLPLYKKSKILLAYMALKDEIGLEILIEDALKDKKKVYLPKIDLEKGQMDFYRFLMKKGFARGLMAFWSRLKTRLLGKSFSGGKRLMQKVMRY